MTGLVIAIVGRPNVGKSSLFNRLTKSRDALIADQPGVTRDRQYGIAHYQMHQLLVIDTGGLAEQQDNKDIVDATAMQTMQAIVEADLLLWLVDGRAGITTADQTLATGFRRLDKPIYLLVNKLEGMDMDISSAEFYQLGFGQPWPISAQRGDGVARVLEEITATLPVATGQTNEVNDAIMLSVLGRPNVGKSTLTNQILGEQRVLISERPNTTRDSIRIPFVRDKQHYVIIDTAGVRRRSKITDQIEKVSTIYSFRAIEQAHIVLCVIDAQQGITEQDITLLGIAAKSGKALIPIINKWDQLQDIDKGRIYDQLEIKCRFIEYAKMHFISALYGRGVNNIFNTTKKIWHALQKKYSTAEVTSMLYNSTEKNPPPMIRGRRIKLRYAHLGGKNPIKIIVHGNQTEHLPNHYIRYLARSLRQQMRLVNTPVLVELKQGGNPYQHKKNK